VGNGTAFNAGLFRPPVQASSWCFKPGNRGSAKARLRTGRRVEWRCWPSPHHHPHRTPVRRRFRSHRRIAAWPAALLEQAAGGPCALLVGGSFHPWSEVIRPGGDRPRSGAHGAARKLRFSCLARPAQGSSPPSTCPPSGPLAELLRPQRIGSDPLPLGAADGPHRSVECHPRVGRLAPPVISPGAALQEVSAPWCHEAGPTFTNTDQRDPD